MNNGTTNPLTFWQWVNLRHKIYLDRAAKKPPPWTDDPILSKYRFTNVFRNLDRGTRWFILNVANQHMTPGQYVFNTIVYRCFNLLETGEALQLPIFNWESRREESIKTLNSLPRVFTGAHMTNLSLTTAICIFDTIWTGRADIALKITNMNSCEETFWYFYHNVYGAGTFTGHQWVQDLRLTPLLRYAPDGPRWSFPGPGCKRGLEWMGLPPDPSGMMQVWEHQEERADWVPWLEAKDVQQGLCEYQKYRKLYEGVVLNKDMPKYRYFDSSTRELL